MKRICVWARLGMVVVSCAMCLSAQQLGTQQPVNFNAVAILRWYPANLTATFGAGSLSLPSAVAFDGANIWVTNDGSNSVAKLRASDGALLGNFGVAAGADYVAFDGANIWVTNGSIVSPSITKLRASDGTVLGTFALGPGPVSLVFDGANIWVAISNSNRVTKLRVSDGAVLGTFAVGSNPHGVAFDGANIWVATATT
jgi:hypothetical protein